MTRKKLLFITPVMPSIKGRGRNFRAFQWVNLLSKTYRVTVLCTSIYGEYQFRDDEQLAHLDCEIIEWGHKHSFLQRIKNLFFLRPSSWNNLGDDFRESDKLHIPAPDIILCFRSHNVPVAIEAKKTWKNSALWLDIDELDSHTKSAVARLMFSKRYFFEAFKTWLDARLFSLQESGFMPLFDQIYTSTKTEKYLIEHLYGPENVSVFENMLQNQRNFAPLSVQQTPFRFLFVGDSNYFPNLDAIDAIIFDLVPKLKEIAGVPFSFVIIGGKIGRKQHRQIKKSGCIEFYEDAEDLEQIYNQTNAVVVPLRAGGGSSLKFLEAFRYKKPVVSSEVGARGFKITHGKHVLIGKNSGEIVTHCNSLMKNPKLGVELAENGHGWFIENNSYEIRKRKIKKHLSRPDFFEFQIGKI